MQKLSTFLSIISVFLSAYFYMLAEGFIVIFDGWAKDIGGLEFAIDNRLFVILFSFVSLGLVFLSFKRKLASNIVLGIQCLLFSFILWLVILIIQASGAH